MNQQITIEKNKTRKHLLRSLCRIFLVFEKSLDIASKKVYTMYIQDDKEEQNMIAIVQKWGNSQGIRLPKHLLDAAQIKPSDKVNVELQDGSIVITKVSRKTTIEDLFAGYKGNYAPTELDWGDPVGEEVW